MKKSTGKFLLFIQNGCTLLKKSLLLLKIESFLLNNFLLKSLQTENKYTRVILKSIHNRFGQNLKYEISILSKQIRLILIFFFRN